MVQIHYIFGAKLLYIEEDDREPALGEHIVSDGETFEVVDVLDDGETATGMPVCLASVKHAR